MNKPIDRGGKSPTELSQLSFMYAQKLLNQIIDDGMTPSEGFLIAAQLVARILELCDDEDQEKMLEKFFVGAAKAAMKDLRKIRKVIEEESPPAVH